MTSLHGKVAVVAGATRGAGRGIAVALASDTERARWNQRSVTSAEIAKEYGFTDIDGRRPDMWQFMADRERGLDVSHADYR